MNSFKSFSKLKSEYNESMKKFPSMVLLFIVFLPFWEVFSVAPAISFIPESPQQGEPVMIVIENVKLSDIASTTISGKLLKLFVYNNKPTAFFGIDINKKSGDYEIKVILKDGTSFSRNLVIAERKKIEEVFSIPKKLGGDTIAGQKTLVVSLAKENAVLNKIPTNQKIFWSDKFIFPLENPIVTDDFGYSRKTGGYTLTHKGTDFRAKNGTKVMAMNNGVVRVANIGRNYGKHIVIDHGLGVMTFYLHLSKINVKVGDTITKGQLIGLSGETGYAEAPHLHLSVRIYNISVDPVKFMDIFK